MEHRILVVEDEGIVAEDIRTTLLGLGYSVPVTAASGEEALRAASDTRPALALLDIRIQGKMDGIETADRLRERFGIPVVFLTSYSDEATLARAKEAQPLGYLLKPFNERELRAAIEVALYKHRMESNLADRERWFATTLKSIGDAVIAGDSAQRVAFMNPVAESLTGWRQDEALGKPVEDVFKIVDTRTQQPQVRPEVRALRERVVVSLPNDTSLMSKTGQPVPIGDSAAPIVDGRGDVLGVVVVFRDLRERKAMEERIALAERLAALGRMAAGVAHEINNPLAYVIANIEFVRTRLEELGRNLEQSVSREGAFTNAKIGLREAKEALSDAGDGAERVRRVVSGLKMFARTEVRRAGERTRVETALDSALKLTSHTLRHHARLEKNYETTPPVEADEGQLVQVFTNLLVNAGQAMADGRAESNVIRLKTHTDDRGHAVAEIHDTGIGMTVDQLSRAFEPFFSTRRPGVGTGLGLSICQAILSELGGEIVLESTLGSRTVARVTLPPAPVAQVVPLPIAPSPAASPARRGRVLVIDDEEALCTALKRMLGKAYDVVSETEAKGALSLIEQDARFDAILCDLMMPNMSGADFYEVLRAKNARLAERVVFMTGGAFAPRAEEFLSRTENPHITKPFTRDALDQILARFIR